MMNGRGKSDSAIVAGKPTNKAGQLAAESVEPSAEAKGNASQQSTRRAQDRERVSQALERIRQVARQRKKERFTSLFHHLSVELLRLAFFALKRDAAPGVDGLTWQDYEADLDRKIEYKTLKFGVYKNPLWQSMQHVVNHGSYHRGQVTTLLRQLGAQPVLTDLMHFYRERAVAAKA